MSAGKLLKVSELESYCPEGHTHTDTWGIIKKDTVGAKHVVIALCEMRPGGEADAASHPGAEHGYFLLSGIAEAFVEDKKFLMNPNECLWVPPGAKHGIKAIGRQTIKFIVFSGRP